MNLLIKKFSHLLIELYIFMKRVLGTQKAIEIFSPIMEFLGKTRAPIMAKILKVDVADASSLGKIQDAEDKIFGVRGLWEKKEKKESIKVEMFCPFAEKLKGHSEFCHILVKKFEESTFKTLNPSYSLEIKGNLLSEYGGTGCTFVHKLKDS